MEESAEPAVADGSPGLKMASEPKDIVTSKTKTKAESKTFQQATAMPDLLDPMPSDPSSSSDPSTDPSTDPSGSDDTSPLSFLGTPYSTSQQFDYPFPISNEPRDPAAPQAPLPSALPIASSLASAPSIITAAAAADEVSESTATSPLPSMMSTIAASPDIPMNNSISELRSLSNRSTSSLNSTHSGHTAPAAMVPVASSGNSIRSLSSISPSSSFQSPSNVGMAMTAVAASPTSHQANSTSRHRARHSLTIFPLPPPLLSANKPKSTHSPPITRRPKAMTVSNSTGPENGLERRPSLNRPASGSISSLSITSVQLLSGGNDPPIPPSLLSKMNRPRNTSSNSNSSSYFSVSIPTHKTPNSRDFFGSPGGGEAPSASAPSSPPLGTDSSTEFFKPLSASAQKSTFSVFRPHLGRSNSSASQSASSFNSRPFLSRSTTGPQLQNRAYAAHMRHQQEQQLKLQEERKKKEKEREKKEKKKEKKARRSSLSLTRSMSSSSSSSAKTKNSSASSRSPASASLTDGFKLSPTQRSIVENAISESEGSASPEGTKKIKRRRSSVRRVLEKTGSLVGFNLNLNAAKRVAGNN